MEVSVNSGVYVGLVRVVSEVSVLRQKVLNFHWNVEGEGFYEKHLLFERVYESIDGFVDRLAEGCRKYGRAPGEFSVYLRVSGIKETDGIPAPGEMVSILMRDFEVLKKTVYEVNESAESAREIGVVNLLGDLAETIDVSLYLLSSSK
jgi:starvation-inducible DNA-binding protein